MAAKSVLESDVWKKQGIVVIDGGLGTEVDDRGYSINDNPLWSASVVQSNPEVIRDIHLDFLRAGAEVIITATFSASIEKFCEHLNMTEDEAKELIKLPVRLAREARDIFIKENPERPRPLIAGSVGPYGSGKWEFVKDGKAATYTGIYVDSISKETIKEFHRPRIECLLSENVDLLAIEAIPAQLEVEIIVDLLKDYPEAKAWACFNCKSDNLTCHGEVFADAIASVSKSDQVIGVGVNCTPPEYIEKLLLSAKDVCNNKPLVCYPNSGEVYTKEDPTVGVWKGTRQSTLDKYVPKWASAGAKLIGKFSPLAIPFSAGFIDSDFSMA
jgi:homocysteine S-methyltransferase